MHLNSSSESRHLSIRTRRAWQFINPSSSAASAPAPEELRLADLDWIGDLGAGGFARVSKACHRHIGAVFALKMSFDADPDEAKVLSRAAGSPHVIDCHAMLRGPAGEPAYALEFMDAGSLRRILCRRRGRRFLEPALTEALRRGTSPAPLPWAVA
jgi:mitogen-activated protein kinase kinase